MHIAGGFLVIIFSHRVGKKHWAWLQPHLGLARCSLVVWPHRLHSTGPEADGYIHRAMYASSYFMLSMQRSGLAFDTLECLVVRVDILVIYLIMVLI